VAVCALFYRSYALGRVRGSLRPRALPRAQLSGEGTAVASQPPRGGLRSRTPQPPAAKPGSPRAFLVSGTTGSALSGDVPPLSRRDSDWAVPGGEGSCPPARWGPGSGSFSRPKPWAPTGGLWAGGIVCLRFSPRWLLTSVLCPRRSPRPHAAPRDARPSSADASSRVQRSPSPPALRLPESPPAPPACAEASRGATAWPPEGSPALNAVVANPPPRWGSLPLCPQPSVSPWTNRPAPRRGCWVHPCRSSPLYLALSPSFSPFLFIVFVLVAFPLLLPFISALKIFQGTFNRIFFFLCKAAIARLQIKHFKNRGSSLRDKALPVCHPAADQLPTALALRAAARTPAMEVTSTGKL